ncbi:Acetyl-CoA carboxylase, carboxyltransferase component [Saccharopolyspora shandongensis]|uniref:Acetyl-CoA carboxylase, carboxyltransferase component n=1 Tax=Saccharopolyspora shandongensis TaxID=418495 RepID=A0A1H3HNS1_9PSEU|nr:carboxyl transferase domain-containing protein [Saccharopolyspora shandongensis]SDY16885.1 Acetyl-CoA carboxylase, carboxyltransferase component [Saccharopolyspora shandongensis]
MSQDQDTGMVEPELSLEQEFQARRTAALAMGGPKKLEQRRAEGRLNARERIELLLDKGTFRESGLFATSAVEADQAKTPADGKIIGSGQIDGRRASVIAYDFTVKGSSSSPVSNKKMSHFKELTAKVGMPLVYLSESTGVRMPDAMGGTGMGAANSKRRFLRQRQSPWASAAFGYCFGSAAWHTVSADFAVFRKGSVLAVSSPGLVSRATGQQVDAQELGGWKLHAEVTGYADAVADTDEEAIELIRRFLSYLPSHNGERPPLAEVPAGSGERSAELKDIVPAVRTKTYDVRKVIEIIADAGSVFPIKARYGKSLVTSLVRIGGQSVGIIANNPMFKGGALDGPACDKATSFLVLCDSYNIPVVFLVDQPGFLIGLEAERNKIAGKVINWMNALSLVTVPKIAITLRKNYGQAYVNMGGGLTADTTAGWWSTEVSFMDPSSAVSVVHGIDRESDPELFEQRFAEMAKGTTVYDVARVFGFEHVLDPSETRDFILGALEEHYCARTGGIGEHLLSSWPTSF